MHRGSGGDRRPPSRAVASPFPPSPYPFPPWWLPSHLLFSIGLQSLALSTFLVPFYLFIFLSFAYSTTFGLSDSFFASTRPFCLFGFLSSVIRPGRVQLSNQWLPLGYLVFVASYLLTIFTCLPFFCLFIFVLSCYFLFTVFRPSYSWANYITVSHGCSLRLPGSGFFVFIGFIMVGSSPRGLWPTADINFEPFSDNQPSHVWSPYMGTGLYKEYHTVYQRFTPITGGGTSTMEKAAKDTLHSLAIAATLHDGTYISPSGSGSPG